MAHDKEAFDGGDERLFLHRMMFFDREKCRCYKKYSTVMLFGAGYNKEKTRTYRVFSFGVF